MPVSGAHPAVQDVDLDARSEHLLARRELPAQHAGFFLRVHGSLFIQCQRCSSFVKAIGQNRYSIEASSFQHP